MDETLRELRQRLPNCRLVLLGASALERQGLLRRRTLDLDLMVIAERAEVDAALQGWRRASSHRWLSPSGVPVDLLPVRAEDVERGNLSFEPGVEMSLAGFELLLDRSGTTEITALGVELASPPAIFVLKIIAWKDRPAERSKDLGDMATIMENYLSEDDDRRYIGPPTERGWFQEEAAAWWLGRDLARLCGEDLLVVVRGFFERLQSDEALAGLVAARAPRSWNRSTDVVAHRASIAIAGVDEDQV